MGVAKYGGILHRCSEICMLFTGTVRLSATTVYVLFFLCQFCQLFVYCCYLVVSSATRDFD